MGGSVKPRTASILIGGFCRVGVHFSGCPFQGTSGYRLDMRFIVVHRNAERQRARSTRATWPLKRIEPVPGVAVPNGRSSGSRIRPTSKVVVSSWTVAPVGEPYRYKLNLVPRDHHAGDGRWAECAGKRQWAGCDRSHDPMPGWELITSRVTQDGDELSLFRRPIKSERAS